MTSQANTQSGSLSVSSVAQSIFSVIDANYDVAGREGTVDIVLWHESGSDVWVGDSSVAIDSSGVPIKADQHFILRNVDLTKTYIIASSAPVPVYFIRTY